VDEHAVESRVPLEDRIEQQKEQDRKERREAHGAGITQEAA
jgi:hypothetical protein